MREIVETINHETRDDIRIVSEYDNDWTEDSLFGDTYNPETNPDIPAEQLEREKKEEYAHINCVGVYGYTAQKKCTHCNSWIDVETIGGSIWGVIGDCYPELKEELFDVAINKQNNHK